MNQFNQQMRDGISTHVHVILALWILQYNHLVYVPAIKLVLDATICPTTYGCVHRTQSNTTHCLDKWTRQRLSRHKVV